MRRVVFGKKTPTPVYRIRVRPLLLAVVLATGLGACSQDVLVRGNLPDADTLSKIDPGVHSRRDVAKLLGSPSTISTFEDSRWYYIGQKTTQFAFFRPEVLERKVIVVSFDDEGVVADTTIYTLEDGQEVDLVGRVTPTEGRDFTFIQQLFGNLGRFSKKEE